MSKTIEHQFGRENEVSVQHLLQSFCNHIYLGQWECARACIGELRDQRELAEYDITALLSDCVNNPSKKSIGRQSINELPSPHHLSWLCFQELEKGKTEVEEIQIKKWGKELEFRLLLCEHELILKTSIIKELYKYYTTALNNDPLASLSQRCVQNISTSLVAEPAKTHILLKQLIEVLEDETNLQGLYAIYVSCMQTLVNYITAYERDRCNSESDGEFMQVDSNAVISCKKNVDSLFGILRVFEVPCEHYNENLKVLLEQLFLGLIELCQVKCDPIIQEELLYGVLLGCKGVNLIEIYHAVKWKSGKKSALNVCPLKPGEEFTEEECHFLGLSMLNNRKQAWLQLLMLSLQQKKHYLDSVMGLSMKLIENNKFEELSSLLQVPEFSPLCPLVLLVGWEHCCTTTQTLKLVQAVKGLNEENQTAQKEPLMNVCERLSTKAGILNEFVHKFRVSQIKHTPPPKWCILAVVSRREFLPPEYLQDSAMKNMLQSGLQLQSTLYMVYRYTKLAELPQDRLVQLLNAMHESNRKSRPPSSVSNQTSSTSCTYNHEIPIYLAFCAIKDFLAGLTQSANMVHWVVSQETSFSAKSIDADSTFTMTPTTPNIPYIRPYSAATTSSTASEIEALQLRYTDSILSHLENVKDTLSNLYPLNYRMEILENLFSLLFLRTDDVLNENVGVVGGVCGVGESGGEEGTHRDWDVNSTGNATPKAPGTPLSPSTPVYLTPIKFEDHHLTASSVPPVSVYGPSITTWSESGVARSKASRELFSRFMEDAQQHNYVVVGAAGSGGVDSLMSHSSQSNETDNTVNANSLELKESVKDTESTENDGRSKPQTGGNSRISGTSTSESFNTDKIGYIANEYFVRDSLLMLKQCLENLTSELIKPETSVGDKGCTGDVCDTFQCSILLNEVKSRSVQLMQYVSEGLWKFQLVSHQFIPFEYGKIMGDVSKLEDDYHTDEELKSSDDEDQTQSSLKKRRRKRTNSSTQSAATDSHVTTDGSQSTSRSTSSHRKIKRSRSMRPRRRAGDRRYMRSVLDSNQGVMSRMLSDRNTLLTMCLRRGKVSQASQVVKLFGLEETAEEAEVLFADHFQAAVSKVLSHDARVQHTTHANSTALRPTSKSSIFPSTSSGTSILSNIASIAAKGVASLSVTNTAEHLLGLTIQPSLMLKQHLDSISTYKSVLSQLVNEELVPAMIVLDLTASGSNAWESANVLLDLALKRLPSSYKSGIIGAGSSNTDEKQHHCSNQTNLYQDTSSGSSQSLSSVKVKGIVGILQNLSSLVVLSSNKPASEITSGLCPKGINKCLNTGIAPLFPESYKTFLSCVKEMYACLSKAHSALEDTTSGVKISKDKSRPIVRIAFKHLSSLLEKPSFSCGLMKYIYRDCRDEESNYNYLQFTYDYFKTLRSLVAEYKGSSRDEITQLEYFTMITESPTKTLGKILFHYKADPYKLQKTTDMLGVELVQVIVHNMCPAISYKMVGQGQGKNYQNCGKHILNNAVDQATWRDNAKPMFFITELLCMFIKGIRDHMSQKTKKCSVQLNHLMSFSRTQACDKLLNETKKMAGADLTLLETNEEKMSFFLNLANLMFLHGALYFAKTNPIHLFALMGKSSHIEKICAEKSIKFKVGQLGIVSWYDVQYSILGAYQDNTGGVGSNLNAMLATILELGQLDPWTVYGPSTDYRVKYTMIDGNCQYYMQVYYPDILKEQLKLAELCMKDKKVIKCDGLILSREEWEEFQKYASYSVTDSYNTAEHTSSPVFQHLSFEQVIDSYKGYAATYKLSSVVEGYLKHKSKLVATLANLVVNNNNVNGGEGKSADEKLDDLVRQIQIEFPTLHRHLQTLATHLLTGKEKYDAKSSNQVWYMLNRNSLQGSMLLNSTHSKQFQSMLNKVFIELIQQRKWNELTNLVIDCPAVGASNDLLYLQELSTMLCIASMIAHENQTSPVVPVETGNANNKKNAEEFVSGKQMVWKLICCVEDVSLRVRVLLCSQVIYSAAECVKYMQQSLQWLSSRGDSGSGGNTSGGGITENPLTKSVVRKITEMKMYQEIADCAKRELDRLPSQHIQELQQRQSYQISNVQYYHNSAIDILDQDDQHSIDPIFTLEFLQRLLSWKSIKDLSERSSELVLEFLLKCNQFKVARTWVDVFHHYDFTVLIEESCIFYQLEQNDPNVTMVMNILERVKGNNQSECKTICDNLIPRLSRKKYSLMLVKYVITYLGSDLTRDELINLYLLQLGCSALLCLPSNIHCDYDHLISTPLLLLEQLLMNMKIDLSGKVLQKIKMELTHIQDETVLRKFLDFSEKEENSDEFLVLDNGDQKSNEENRMSPKINIYLHDDDDDDDADILVIPQKSYNKEDLLHDLDIDMNKCDKLLVEYANKALEFGVVILEDNSGRSSSMSHISSSGTLLQGIGQTRRLSLMNMGASSVGSNVMPCRRISRENSSGQLNKLGSLLRSTGTSVPVNLDKRGASMYGTPDPIGEGMSKLFVMPAEPPSRDQWMRDSATSVCLVCRIERFSMFNRRHHCRRCGRVVCSTCSSKTLMIQGSSMRACNECYEQSHKPKQTLSSKVKAERLRQRLTSPGPNSLDSHGASGNHSVGSKMIGEIEVVSQPLSTEYQYFLMCDDEEMNDLKREEFYYDHAPSTSLCLSILDLHSDPIQCAQVIMDLCDSVSTYLQSLSPGVKNPEVDYGLVISMLKYLLFNAKLKCQKAHDSSGVTKCDLYLDRVNLLDMLVANNISYLPSIQQLTRMDVLRRLRDKLIEEEHWDVAKTVSTKCGIDPSGVWIAWGQACLKVGEYKQAREKFAKCLKLPTERQQAHTSSKMLNDIVECLRSSAVYNPQTESLLSQLQSIKDLLAEPTPKKSSEFIQEEPYFEECVYYLTTYGTYGSLVSFYQKNGQYAKALQYILTERCVMEVFIESLLLPCLQVGELSRLQDAMLTIDSTLSRWEAHLTAVCRYLNKTKNMNTLYHVQLFMKDYIRAAMTCVTVFYQKGARTYLDLHGRLVHLQDAKGHLESYIEKKMWMGAVESSPSRRGGSVDTAVSRLIMTPREINKYIHSIDLQMEVTKYLSHYLENLQIVLMFTGEKAPPSTAASPTKGMKAGSGGLQRARHRSSPDLFIKPGELPTLFGSTKMKSELVALILLSGNNVNDGFGLAFRIIQDMKLDSASIYALVGVTFAHQHKYHFIKQLLGCMKDSGLCTDHNFDDVIIPCVEVMIADADQLSEADALIKLLRSDINKINAYMWCGKLKSAYLIAVKTQRVEVVQRIEQDAMRLNQPAVRSICKKWLQQHGYKSLEQ